MTTIPSGRIPASAQARLESLAVWSIMALNRINPSNSVLERKGDVLATSTCQFAVFQDDNNQERIVVRLSVPVNPEWKTNNTDRIWGFVGDISQTTINNGFLSNP
jgi:hypothetical protein